MTSRRSQIVSWGALLVGLLLLVATLWFLDFSAVRLEIRKLGFALPLVLVVSGLWHLARTVAWAACFPEPRRVGFWHLARVRLAAEAFSYLTIRGVAGEPLKVVLLRRDVDPKTATAAVALERLAFMVLTTVIIGLGAVLALATLPLTRIWFRIFRAFAIGAGVLVLLALAVLTGRGTYVERVLGGARGRVARFVVAVERQLLELVRHNPKRLLLLAAMSVICYLSMGLEVWIVLRAVGVPASGGGSLAVETFSRVASFASAFIPANIGALEASSIAAVGAIGAASGGAALALARRIRGIFWAAAGLLIYPRGSWERERSHDASNESTLLYTASPDVPDAAVFARVAGLPIAERVFRAAHKAGCVAVRLAAPGREEPLTALAHRAGLAVIAHDAHDDAEPKLRAGAGDIPRPGGGFSMMATRVHTANDLAGAEREIRAAVFKPTDHNLARFNRRISLPISVALLRTPLTANQFSIALLFLGLYSAWLFSIGSYLTGVAGAATSLAASILDGCDGEIARLKHQESDFGCWLETVTDYTYYLAIFIGMTVGSVRYTGLRGFYVIGGLALAGLAVVFGLLLYLRHRMTGHSPSRFGGTVKGKFKEGAGKFTLFLAKLSNAATRAQMPYGIMALAIFGAVPLVVILAAIGTNTYWMALAWKLRALLGDQRREALSGAA